MWTCPNLFKQPLLFVMVRSSLYSPHYSRWKYWWATGDSVLRPGTSWQNPQHRASQQHLLMALVSLVFHWNWARKKRLPGSSGTAHKGQVASMPEGRAGIIVNFCAVCRWLQPMQPSDPVLVRKRCGLALTLGEAVFSSRTAAFHSDLTWSMLPSFSLCSLSTRL